MALVEQTIGTVVSVARLKSSPSGNPRYALNLADGRILRTSRDAGCAYVVSSTWHDVRIRATLSRAGYVIGIDILSTFGRGE
jgi:hypothetical protein